MTCQSCRYHSKQVRAKVLASDDPDAEGAADFEMLASSETETENVYFCQHPTGKGREIGLDASAGVGCETFEAPKQSSKMSEFLLRQIQASEERAARAIQDN
jgi:hypothetical protein